MSAWLPDLAGLGWREAVLGLVVGFAIYALVVLVRMLRLALGRSAPPTTPPADSFQAVQRDALQPYLREMAAGDEAASAARSPAAGAAPAADEGLAWERPPTDFAERQVRQGLEREVATLREEVDSLRGALAALREEVRQDMAGIKAQQSVSPFYRDAMQMALAGASADTIAERCGIARGEAELVVALVHGGGNGLNDNLGMEGDDDGRRPRA